VGRANGTCEACEEVFRIPPTNPCIITLKSLSPFSNLKKNIEWVKEAQNGITRLKNAMRDNMLLQ
jgi:hypothetical protein